MTDDLQTRRRKMIAQLSKYGGGGFFNVAEQLQAMDQRLETEAYGEVVPPPIVSWMYEHGSFRRFVQYIWVTTPPNIVAQDLELVLQAILDRHDMLRAQLAVVGGGVHRLTTRAPGAVQAADILTRVVGSADDDVATHVGAVVESIDPYAGVMMRALWCDVAGPGNGNLLLVVHHLAADVVSWYVLVAGIVEAWEQVCDRPAADDTDGDRQWSQVPGWGSHREITLPGERTSYREWAQLMAKRSHRPEVAAQRDYWLAQLAGPDPELGSRLPDPQRDTWASLRSADVVTGVEETRVLLDKLAAGGAGIGVREFLLTALTMTVMSWRVRRGNAPAPHDEGVQLHLEGHGRDDGLLDPGSVFGAAVDTSSTVGWFTQIFPVRLGAGRRVDVDTARRDPSSARELLRAVTADIAAVPNNGLDYGLLRYKRRDRDLVAASGPQVIFNYIGRLDMGRAAAGEPGHDGQPRAVVPWSLVTDSGLNLSVPAVPEPGLPLRYVFDMAAMVRGGEEGPQLVAHWRWSDELTTEEEAAELAELWSDAVITLASAL